jgi:hypothetical protein
MSSDRELEEGDVEDRILGDWMRRLQEERVDFEIVETMEELLDEDDFGGDERIIEEVEQAVENED